MKTKVLNAIEHFSLLGEEKNITVALSGGADSMALLGVLLELKEELSLNISAAHFNHLIRGEEAQRDEDFVRAECEKRGVELFCEKADVPKFAKQNSISLELAARELRYDFLKRVSKGLVATAHTASDNLETVILNLARGSGIDGLCGIPPKRDIFIRPLIFCLREDIEDYCRQKNIPFVTDSSNLSDDYTRNKIRHNIVPLLKELNPAAEDAVLRTANLLRDDSEFLNCEAQAFLEKWCFDGKLYLEAFGDLKEAVGKRVVKKFIESVKGLSLENIHIESAFKVAASGGKANLPMDNYAVSENGFLIITSKSDKIQEKKVKITEKDNTFFEESQKINNLLLNNLIDCDKIVGNWELRTRLSGDSIRLKGRGCTKTLTRLMSESRVPANQRDSLPIIADEKGVIWVCGIGVAERCAVSQKTKKVYLIEVL